MSLVALLAVLLIVHGLVHVSLNTVPYGSTTPFCQASGDPSPAIPGCCRDSGSGPKRIAWLAASC